MIHCFVITYIAINKGQFLGTSHKLKIKAAVLAFVAAGGCYRDVHSGPRGTQPSARAVSPGASCSNGLKDELLPVLPVWAGTRCRHCQKANREGQASTPERAFTQSWTHAVRPPVFYTTLCKGVLLQHPQRGSHRDCANVGMTEGLENSQVNAPVNSFHPGASP